MARRRDHNTTRRSDDTFDISSSQELLRRISKPQKPLQQIVPRLLPKVTAPKLFPLKQFEDRREYHPDRQNRPPAALPRSSRKLVIVTPQNKAATRKTTLPSKLGFSAPQGVVLCVRRKQRREILFAKSRTGRGAHTPKKRNAWSNVKC